MKYGIYIRFVEGHGRWMRKEIPSKTIATSWAEQEAIHWSQSTAIEVWEYSNKPDEGQSLLTTVYGEQPRLPHADE